MSNLPKTPKAKTNLKQGSRVSIQEFQQQWAEFIESITEPHPSKLPSYCKGIQYPKAVIGGIREKHTPVCTLEQTQAYQVGPIFNTIPYLPKKCSHNVISALQDRHLTVWAVKEDP